MKWFPDVLAGAGGLLLLLVAFENSLVLGLVVLGLAMIVIAFNLTPMSQDHAAPPVAREFWLGAGGLLIAGGMGMVLPAAGLVALGISLVLYAVGRSGQHD